jgi:plasmid stabilization system protein ParE
MVKAAYTIVWTKRAQIHTRQAYEHICADSPKNAFKVLEDILALITKAGNDPTIYAPDKYKINNDGTYRAFTKHRYRVSYRISNDILRVLSVRHTSRKPKVY